MKRCPYCGKKCADEEDVCPDDRRPLERLEDTPRRPATASGSALPAFNVSVASRSRWVSSGKYRVYLRNDDMLFIQTEATTQKGLEALAGFLGPVGHLIGFAVRLWSGKQAGSTESQNDNQDPDDLMQDSEDNFRLYIPEIQDVTAKPTGRLTLSLRDRRKLKLGFATSDDLKAALSCLAPRLSSTVKIRPEWNEPQYRLHKKERSAPTG